MGQAQDPTVLRVCYPRMLEKGADEHQHMTMRNCKSRRFD